MISARSPRAGGAGERCPLPSRGAAGREQQVPLPAPGREDSPRPWLQQEAGAIILVISLEDLKPPLIFCEASISESPLTPRRFWLGLSQPERNNRRDLAPRWMSCPARNAPGWDVGATLTCVRSRGSIWGMCKQLGPVTRVLFL